MPGGADGAPWHSLKSISPPSLHLHPQHPQHIQQLQQQQPQLPQSSQQLFNGSQQSWPAQLRRGGPSGGMLRPGLPSDGSGGLPWLSDSFLRRSTGPNGGPDCGPLGPDFIGELPEDYEVCCSN